MLALERRNLILEQLQSERHVVVSELSRRFGVSEETIRRDLDKLEKEGLAVKSYGGAVINEDTVIDLPFNVRKQRNVAGKQKIAELIAPLIHDGERISLDASSTAVLIAKALRQKQRLTLLTNSMEVLLELSDVSGWDIISTGGQLGEGYLAFFGTRAENAFRSCYVDTVILSCKGLDMERGLAEGHDSLSAVKHAMMSSGRRIILAVDSTKFGQPAFSISGEIRDVDLVVTDRKPSEQWLACLERLGVECLYPEGSIPDENI